MLKKDLRKKYKQLRKDLSPAEMSSKSLAIFEMTRNAFDLDGKSISIFLPIERFFEIDTWHFLNEIPSKFYLPTITGKGKLEHLRYENPEQIEVTPWGIPEPTYGEKALAHEFDLVIVPLLAINKKGYRVGYGKGFYDQFLIQCAPTCQFIGVSYFDTIEEIADVHDADVPLHYLVSPEGVLKF